MSENIQWYRWGSREKEQSTAQARLTDLRPARRAYEIFSRSGLGQRRAGCGPKILACAVLKWITIY